MKQTAPGATGRAATPSDAIDPATIGRGAMERGTMELGGARPALDRYGMPLRTGAAPRAPARDPQAAIFLMFATIAVAVTFGQKLGFGRAPDAIVPLIVPIVLLVIGAGIVVARPIFRPRRIGLYLAFLLASATSTVLFAPRYSVPSLALYAVLYLPMLVAFPTSPATYRRCMRFYSDIALVFVALELVQHAIQLTIGWRYWPDLDALLPANALIPNYVYIQPIVWGMHYMKPNAIVFLEVSFLSQYLALALAIELVLFQRIARTLIFAAAVLLTFAGTGLLVLLITAPVLLSRLKLRSAIPIVAVLLLLALAASQLGWLDLIAHRFGEFQKGGTSANMRFIEPAHRMIQFLDRPGALYAGIGTGQIEKGDNFQWWPITKAVIEYGLIPGLLFYAFFTLTLFDSPPNVRIAIVLFVWFGIEGGLLNALNPVTIILFSTMFRIERREPRRRAAPPPAFAAP